jgi:hypothetical protein
VIASLGFASLLGIIAVATPHRGVAPAKDETVLALSAESAVLAGSRRPLRHIRRGRWQAEARTFVAVIRYLIEPEFRAKPSGGFTPLQVATPTNIVSTRAPMRSTS